MEQTEDEAVEALQAMTPDELNAYQARMIFGNVSEAELQALRDYAHTPVRPTREELAHEVERLRGLMEQQDRRIIRLTAELNMHARPKGFVNAKKRRRMEARAVKHAIVEVMR